MTYIVVAVIAFLAGAVAGSRYADSRVEEKPREPRRKG